MKIVKIALLIVVAVVLLTGIGVYSGIFNFAADVPHWGITIRLIEAARDRFIVRQTDDVKVPANLDDPRLVTSGAGEYAEMCTGCHLAPGMKDTEMRVGLYPKPPNLAALAARRTPAQQFWIVKHGLKMTGMPAWGLTHDDERIWSMVAFLQRLPELTPAAYHEMVEAGEGGHHHDEMGGENHEQGDANEHGESSEADKPAGEPAHEHAPGTSPHEHAPQTNKLPPTAVAAASVVDRFQSLLAKGDTAGATAVLNPSVLIFESGEVEESRAEYASHHLQADATFLKSAQIRVLSRTGGAAGDFAWVATESELTTRGSKPMNMITTETMVLKRDQDTWRIAHIHWSSRKKE
jgi:ketosteroid isomerase-like protein/mono/diheme cytochrome c family protein